MSKADNEIEDRTPYFIQEFYKDQENLLAQAIMYKFDDYKQRDYLRQSIHPHLTILYKVNYLNKNIKRIKNYGWEE